MPSRSAIWLYFRLSVFALLTVAAVVLSLSFDLNKFRERDANPEDRAMLQGIGSPGELESALKQHPSSGVLQLMAKSIAAADDAKRAVDQLSAQIEPAGLSKELNFGTVSRDELESFRRDLKTAEANTLAFLPRYAAIFKAEREQVDRATVSLHVSGGIASQLLDGLKQRHARTLKAISLVLSARAGYYRAYDQYVAFFAGELGSFKVVGGQFVFPLQGTVERYNTVAQAMTSAGKHVNELEADLKKLQRPVPEDWIPLTGAK